MTSSDMFIIYRNLLQFINSIRHGYLNSLKYNENYIKEENL